MEKIHNVFDYMEWRGDLRFDQDPFNEIDSVILGMVCFLDFSEMVPGPAESGSISLADAMARMPLAFEEEHRLGAVVPDVVLDMAHMAAASPRYADAMLFGFENTIDEEKEMQFAALSFRLSDGSIYVAFRGTDDTLVGWKEDFNMTFMSHVPAQQRAAEYLNCVAGRYEGPIRTGGHSKGGNLAIWSAVHCNAAVRPRIVRAYSNDGPGFTREMLESEAYLTMRDRCINFVPQSSLVGMLMEHDENYRIIYSDRAGPMQHDPFSWAVERNHYVYLDSRSAFGEHSDASIRLWLNSMTHEERRDLFEDLFEVLGATGAKTLTDLTQTKGLMVNTLKTLSGYDKPRRQRINRLLARFVAAQVEAAAPETELLDKVGKLEKLAQSGKFDWKKALSNLDWDDK